LYKPDFVTSPAAPDVGFIHRKLQGADVYFVANTSNHPVHTWASFRVAGGPEEWNPFTGEISISDASLSLEPYESRVCVLSAGPGWAMDGRGRAPAVMDLSADWNVGFPSLNHNIKMQQLRSWTDDEETRYYAGQAIYTKSISVPADFLVG